MTNTPYWKLRRLAPRALKVLHRHSSIPAIGAFAASVVPAANAYVAAYDAVRAHEATWKREMAEGRGAMKSLLDEVQLWRPHVARESPTFDLSTIGDRPDVPEDLIEDALAVATELRGVRESSGATPTWATGGATALETKAAAAERETDEAAAADARWTELRRALEAAASAFDAALGNFRRGLRPAIGRAHPDFQKLRAEKAAERDEDDDTRAPVAAPTPSPVPRPG